MNVLGISGSRSIRSRSAWLQQLALTRLEGPRRRRRFSASDGFIREPALVQRLDAALQPVMLQRAERAARCRA